MKQKFYLERPNKLFGIFLLFAFLFTFTQPVSAVITCDYYADADGDGYVNMSDFIPDPDCDIVPPGYPYIQGTGFGADCDDSDWDVYPGAFEACDFILDNNCDGFTDYNESDDDGDGYTECDGDCNDALVEYYDGDWDGYASDFALPVPCGGVTSLGDCDDFDWNVYPGAFQACDGILDNNCDYITDDNETDDDGDGYTECQGDCNDALVEYYDGDWDGYASDFALPVPCGGVTSLGDCDDFDWNVYPGAYQACDGVLDNNCDYITDDNETDDDGDGYTECQGDCNDALVEYYDGDWDGYASDFALPVPCGGVTALGDCDDFDWNVYPGAYQACDGVLDNNCDYITDDNETDDDGDGYTECQGDCNDALVEYYDADDDGFASDYALPVPCGGVTALGDCDDFDWNVYPGATEVCNTIDDNCDGVVDEGFSPPSFDAPTPTCGDTVYVGVGINRTFTVSASDVDAGETVTLTASGVPAGATLAPVLPTAGNPVSTTFSWTPLMADIGVHSVTFTATDDCGKTTSCTILVKVYACKAAINLGADATSYYGYAPQQTVTRTANPTGGPNGVYTYSWSLSRDLMCNIYSNNGDESFSGGTCTDNSCPGTGSPASSAPYPACSGSNTISAQLMAPATVCVTITDAGGCTASDCFVINATDVRCFAGNSGPKKVAVCHNTGSTTNPWVQLCVDKKAVQTFLRSNTGDYLGYCTTSSKTDETGDLEDATASTGEFRMSVYPNPAHDILNVEFESTAESAYQLQMFDNLGRRLLNNQGIAVQNENKIAIPVSDVAPGVYYLTLNVGDRLSSVKIAVTH